MAMDRRGVQASATLVAAGRSIDDRCVVAVLLWATLHHHSILWTTCRRYWLVQA